MMLRSDELQTRKLYKELYRGPRFKLLLYGARDSHSSSGNKSTRIKKEIPLYCKGRESEGAEGTETEVVKST